jgi:transcription elongation GreA/GreB family factor
MQMSTAKLVPPVHDGEAEIGERITVLDLTTSAVRDYRLVEPDGEQAAGEEELSVRTPLGAALLGRHVGDVISVEDGGRISRLEVVEIDG